MKLTVDAKTLLAALKSTVCERKATIPILSHVHIAAKDGRIAVQGTDLDLSTTMPIPGTVREDGESVLNHRNLCAILAGEVGDVSLESKSNDWTTVTIGECSYNLPGMAIATFPQIPSPDDAKPFALIACATLRILLDRIAFAISSEESRYTLNGAQLATTSNTFRITATDGHRLSTATQAGDFGGNAETLIPSDAVEWLRTNLPKTGDALILTSENKDSSVDTIYFVTPSASFTTRNLTGQFPNWQAVIGSTHTHKTPATHVTLDEPAAIAKTLARLAKIADERSLAGKFCINGKVQVRVSSSDVGEGVATLPAHSDHGDAPEMQIGLSLGYVIEYLKLTATAVQMTVRDAGSAVHFAPVGLQDKGQTWEHVLMPMRV